MKALACLKGSQAGILGGDVLKISNGTPKHTYDSWYVVKRSREGLTEYLARSIAESETYIRNYPDPEDGTVLYSMALSELGL